MNQLNLSDGMVLQIRNWDTPSVFIPFYKKFVQMWLLTYERTGYFEKLKGFGESPTLKKRVRYIHRLQASMGKSFIDLSTGKFTAILTLSWKLEKSSYP